MSNNHIDDNYEILTPSVYIKRHIFKGQSQASSYNDIQTYRNRLGFHNPNDRILHCKILLSHWKHFLLSLEKNGLLLIGLQISLNHNTASGFDFNQNLFVFSAHNYFIPSNTIHHTQILINGHFSKVINISGLGTNVNMIISRINMQMHFNHHAFENVYRFLSKYCKEG